MMMADVKEILVFDIWSDYSCFRVPYTTTSVLSYPFPPRTAVAGIISAILGLKKDSYHEELFNEDNSKISIRILGGLDKIKLGLNLLDTKFGFTPDEIIKKGQPPRIQVPFHFFKDVKYRIYVWLKNNEMFYKLEKMLKEHKSVYTPYLGLAFLIADFEFIGRFNLEPSKGDAHIVTIVPSYVNIQIEKGKKYGKITSVPMFMDKTRKVIKYGDFYIELEGKDILVKNANYFNVINGEDNEKIILF
jgi:CRISPR-associated protein Cas5h